jgi:alkylhydroperoxidase family enzyme
MNSVLLLAALAGGPAAAADPPPDGPRFPKLSHADAWKHLPRQSPKLPNWARTLAESLPRTTAAMLELDHVHRAKNPLGPVVAGKLRWWAADALGCDYQKEYAEADLRRAGLTDDELEALAGDSKDLSKSDRLLRAFARKMSRAASTVTDAEVAELVARFGPERVVGFVHTLAYANFQARILLALDVEVEPGGPLPPLDEKFDSSATVETPARRDWKETTTSERSVSDDRPDWLGGSAGDLQRAVADQKARKPRVPYPPPEALEKLPPEAKNQAGKIVWTRISMGYQPVLTRAWFETMGTFQQEARFDRVFSNTYFWVITRTNDCFY